MTWNSPHGWLSLGVLAAALCLAPAVSGAAPRPAVSAPVDVPALPAGVETRAVALTRIATTLSPSSVVGGVLGLGADQPLYWMHFKVQVEEDLQAALAQELKAAGFKQQGVSLFDDSSGEFELAALIQSVNSRFPSAFTTKGWISLAVEWQIYSQRDRKVVARVSTTGVAEPVYYTLIGGIDSALSVAVINVRSLLASSEFRDHFIVKPGSEATSRVAGASPAPMTYLNRDDGATSVADAIGGVVALFADDGMGTGVLVDESGLLLTNHHVVGDAKFIKVRWPDGVETLGEVVRSSAKRDVALVKTEPRGRKPLRLALQSPAPGEDVFAIGTPLDAKFQNTVTKGIVSANRVFDGLSYIQSDVTVNHGNSGGPLLDKSGRVLGLTQSGTEISGAPVGLNLFVPIRDALDFLSLKPAR